MAKTNFKTQHKREALRRKLRATFETGDEYAEAMVVCALAAMTAVATTHGVDRWYAWWRSTIDMLGKAEEVIRRHFPRRDPDQAS